MNIVYNGQQLAVTGWFVDGHGHRLFLQRGDYAPICPHSVPGLAEWRLERLVGSPPSRARQAEG